MEFKIETNTEITIPQRKGKDVLYFKEITNTNELSFTKENRDLVIETATSKVTVTNYFSQDGLTTSSSVKTIKYDKSTTEIEEINILDSGIIESTLTFVPDKKGNIKGSKFTDTIFGTENNDKIYTNGGNDVIFSSSGNDTINLSKGTEELIYSQNFNKDKINNLGKNDYFEFTNLDSDEVYAYKKGNNLILTTDEKNEITLVNYFKSLKKDNVQTSFQFADKSIDFANGEKDVLSLFYASPKGQKITGSMFNDNIVGSDYSDIIYTNGGNDTIVAGRGNDKIYADGENTELYFEGKFGKDTVYNKKGSSNFIFNTSENINTDEYDLTYTKKNNNLIITSNHENNNGTVTVKDYFKSEKDITIGGKNNPKSLVSILTGIDDISYFDKTASKKGQTIKGSWLRDEFYGSDKADKIYCNGNLSSKEYEFVEANKGNDKIYTGDGKIELKFKQGDGNDIIYLGSDEKSIYILDFGMEEKYYEPLIGEEIVKERFFAEIKFIKSNKSNDLKIVYSYDNGKTTDSVTIKNFYKNPEIAERIKIENYVTVNPTDDNKLSTLMTMGAIETYITGSGKLKGTNYGDFITGSKGKNTIYANSWTDYVYGKGGNDKIFLSNSLEYGQETNKKGLYFNTGDGTDTIYTTDLNFGTISLYSRSTNLYRTNDGNIIAGNMGDYTQHKTDTFYWNDIFDKTITYGKTFDISNSKMIFDDFLNIDTDILIENLGTGVIYNKENLKTEIGIYEELKNTKFHDKNTPLLYEGTNKGDYTISGKKYNIISSNEGDDIVVTNKNGGSKIKIYGGDGKDSVVVTNIKSGTTINSVENLQINNVKEENLRFIFNVEIDSEQLYSEEDEVSIYSTSNISKSQKNNWIEGSNERFFTSGIYANSLDEIENIYIADKKGLNSKSIDIESVLRVVGERVQNYFSNNAEFFKNKGININSYYDFLHYDTGALSKEDLKLYNKHKKALYNIYKTALSKNDTITSSAEEGFKTLAGQKGNDTYIIKENDFINDKITVNDLTGKKDIVNLENINQEDTKLYFDVTLKTNKKGVVTYKKGNAQYTNTGDLLILKEIDYTKNISENNGLTIENYFKKGKIEKIYANGIEYDLSSIKTLSTKIANWLAENNYTSTTEVLEKGTVSAKTELLLMYTNENEQIKAGNEDETTLSGNDIIIADINKNASEPEDAEKTHKINGYDGNDLIIADNIEKEIIINAGLGNDTIYSGKKDNFIYAENGDDYIIINTNGDSSISGGEGNDTITIENVGITTVINGDNGNDVIDAKNAKYYTILNGGDGDDIIHSSTNVDSSCEIIGGDGNDTIYTYYSSDYDLDEVDNIEGKQKISMVTAGSGNDEIHTSKGQNHIYIESTTDTLGAGNDNDIYYYGGGEDILHFVNTNFAEWIFEKSNNDLIIHHANNNKFTIKDYFTFENPNIQIGDEATYEGSVLIKEYLKPGYSGITIYGTENNDTLKITDSNEFVYNLYGKEGNDIIVGFEGNSRLYGDKGNDVIYSYSDIANAKNTTQNILVDMYGGDDNDLYYAQSANNRIIDYSGNDTINAYIDQNTLIYDYKGESDQLKIVGENLNHEKIKIVFNVNSTYTTADGIAFGNPFIMNDENLSKWKEQSQEYKCIAIASNQIETITSTDGYYITSTQIAQLAEDVASWLTDKGYNTVADVLESEKTSGDIESLLAVFDTIEWQQTT